MIRDIIIQFCRFMLLVLGQVFIVNNLKLHTYFNPFIYFLFVLLLPVSTPPAITLLCGFFQGFVMDMYMETGGMHAMATTLIAFIRIYYLRYTLSKEQMDKGIEPVIANTGSTWFFIYAAFMVFVHHIVLFFAESFGFSEFLTTLQSILLSGLVSLLLLVLLHMLFFRVSSKQALSD